MLENQAKKQRKAQKRVNRERAKLAEMENKRNAMEKRLNSLFKASLRRVFPSFILGICYCKNLFILYLFSVLLL